MNETPQERERLAYTLKEAAAMIGLSYMSLYRLIRAQKIKTVSVFRKPLITRVELERFLTVYTGAHVVRVPTKKKARASSTRAA